MLPKTVQLPVRHTKVIQKNCIYFFTVVFKYDILVDCIRFLPSVILVIYPPSAYTTKFSIFFIHLYSRVFSIAIESLLTEFAIGNNHFDHSFNRGASLRTARNVIDCHIAHTHCVIVLIFQDVYTTEIRNGDMLEPFTIMLHKQYSIFYAVVVV